MFWFRRHRWLLKVQSDTSSDCEVVQTVETCCLKKDKQFILRTQHKMGLSLETLLGPTPQFRRWRLQAEVMCSLFGAPVLETQVLKFGDNMGQHGLEKHWLGGEQICRLIMLMFVLVRLPTKMMEWCCVPHSSQHRWVQSWTCINNFSVRTWYYASS